MELPKRNMEIDTFQPRRDLNAIPTDQTGFLGTVIWRENGSQVSAVFGTKEKYINENGKLSGTDYTVVTKDGLLDKNKQAVGENHVAFTAIKQREAMIAQARRLPSPKM